jgi:hypothetical protein
VDDSGCVDVRKCLGGSGGDGQHRVAVKRTLGDCFGKRWAVHELGGHPRLGGVNIGGQEPCGERAVYPHAELNFATEPVAKCRIGS